MADSTLVFGGGAPEAIRGNCRAFRLVKSDWVKVELTPPVPSSQAFQDRSESGAMSVYLEDEINSAGHSLSDLQKRWEGYWVFSLTVNQLIEEFGQEVVRDPQPDFPGHALVRDPSGKRTQGKRSRMASVCVLVSQPGSELPNAQEVQPLDENSHGTSLPDTIWRFKHRVWRYFARWTGKWFVPPS